MSKSHNIQASRRGEFAVMVPQGRLGIMEAEALGKALEPLAAQEAPRIALDLRYVDFIGSRALAVLMQAHGEIAKRKGLLLLGNLRPEVARIFEISRLGSLLHIVGDLESVLKRSEEREARQGAGRKAD
ncbi:MAG: STAS domain-containing protein [Candidatus Sumerlaeota bacterium]|nr:STAS domain-containing protein [Candidatus Sumerlaeota bacterium]